MIPGWPAYSVLWQKDNQNIAQSMYFDNAETLQKRITIVRNTKQQRKKVYIESEHNLTHIV